MCTAVISPALPMMKIEFANIDNAAVLLRTCATMPNIFIAIFSPIFGIIFSKLEKRRLFLAVFFIIYTISGSSVYFLENINQIIFARAILGISISAIMTCGLDLISRYFSGYERSKVLASQTLVMSIGSIFFTILSGYLADFGWRYAFLLYLTGIVMLVLTWIFIKDDVSNYNSKEANARDDANLDSGKFAKMFGQGLPMVICLIGFINMVFFYMIPIQIPFLLKQINPEINGKMISYIITFEVVTSSFFALKYKRIKKNHSFESIFVLAFAIMSISHIGIGYSTKYWHIMLFSGIYGIGMAFIMSNNIVWLVNSVKSGTRGFWIGIMTSAIYLGKFVSPILLYPLVEVVGLSKSYVFAGVSMIFIAAFVLFITDGFKVARRKRIKA